MNRLGRAGAISAAALDIFAVILFVMVIVVFMLIFKYSGPDDPSNAASQSFVDSYSYMSTASFLKSPIFTTQKGYITVAEAMADVKLRVDGDVVKE